MYFMSMKGLLMVTISTLSDPEQKAALVIKHLLYPNLLQYLVYRTRLTLHKKMQLFLELGGIESLDLFL